MHDKNIELLRDEAQRLLDTHIELLEKIRKEPGILSEPRPGEQQTFDHVSILKQVEVLKGELAKLENLEIVLAVVGTMKAGKSTAINAIVGTEVLPNRNRPMTSLPTLIRHTPGQTTPVLRFYNSKPINDLMESLHKAVQDSRVKDHLDRLDRNPDMDELISLIERNSCFMECYHGADEIFLFLKSLNDLVRLTGELEVPFPFASYDEIHEIPVIEIEFAHLREMDSSTGRLTLLDTPGPNEDGQLHLRKMLQEQLSKASAVLAILDFTQLKSIAEAEVRAELEAIASIAEGRLYTLVNKFDQKDRHSDTEEQVKAFVADNLMQGLIRTTDVYPVSSRWGYLANRARSEIFLHNKLPDHAENSWVIDFAEEALGRRWESKIDDLEEVTRSAEALWNDSLFSLPLENVIRFSHARAAALAIDSAAAKLIDIGEKIENFLSLRQTALVKSSRELQTMIDSLMADIAKIEQSQKKTNKEVSDTLARVTKDTEDAFQRIKKNASRELDVYFKEGKRIEKAQHEKAQQLEKPKKSRSWSPFLGQSESSTNENDFDPHNPIINFDSADDANGLRKRINMSVQYVMKSAEDSMREAIANTLDQFNKNFTKNVRLEATHIVDRMNDRMVKDGFSININIPDIKVISIAFSPDEMLSDIISKETEIARSWRRQTGMWGTICSWFDTSDWGWEEYKYNKDVYKIDIRKVKTALDRNINEIFDGLATSVSTYIQQPLNNGVAAFFDQFKTTVEQIRGDLLQSIRDKERSKGEQNVLADQLSKLKKNVPQTLSDSRSLKVDVEPLLIVNP